MSAPLCRDPLRGRLVDGVNAACAGGDDIIDARQKLQIDGGPTEAVVGIYVDAAGIGVGARRCRRCCREDPRTAPAPVPTRPTIRAPAQTPPLAKIFGVSRRR